MSAENQADRAARCPVCGSAAVEVVEDVSDEVTVYGCEACGLTWARRLDNGCR